MLRVLCPVEEGRWHQRICRHQRRVEGRGSVIVEAKERVLARIRMMGLSVSGKLLFWMAEEQVVVHVWYFRQLIVGRVR